MNLWDWGLYGLQSKFQDNQGNIQKSYLEKKPDKQTNRQAETHQILNNVTEDFIQDPWGR